MKVPTGTTTEEPRVAALGSSIPFWYGGLCHRLVTNYLSPSNHLMM